MRDRLLFQQFFPPRTGGIHETDIVEGASAYGIFQNSIERSIESENQ
jgi:hypothetical protein